MKKMQSLFSLKGLIYLILLINAITIALFVNVNKEKKNIAYVNSQLLMSNYEGMIEAKEIFQAQQLQFNVRLDSLKVEYDDLVADYNENLQSLSNEEVRSRQRLLKIKNENLNSFVKSSKESAKLTEDEMLQSVFNKVNAFIKRYSNEQGYDLVFGTTLSGNLLYGEDNSDITDEVLIELNKEYHGV